MLLLASFVVVLVVLVVRTVGVRRLGVVQRCRGAQSHHCSTLAANCCKSVREHHLVVSHPICHRRLRTPPSTTDLGHHRVEVGRRGGSRPLPQLRFLLLLSCRLLFLALVLHRTFKTGRAARYFVAAFGQNPCPLLGFLVFHRFGFVFELAI
jgi:hypothetical protein